MILPNQVEAFIEKGTEVHDKDSFKIERGFKMKKLICACMVVASFTLMSFSDTVIKNDMLYSGYVGYRYIDQSRNLNNAWELGMAVQKVYNDDWWMDFNVGLIPTTLRTTSASQWLLALGVNFYYNVMTNTMFTPYVLAGVGTDLGVESLAGLNVGGGLYVMRNTSMWARAEVKNVYYANNHGNDTIYQIVFSYLM